MKPHRARALISLAGGVKRSACVTAQINACLEATIEMSMFGSSFKQLPPPRSRRWGTRRTRDHLTCALHALAIKSLGSA